MPDTTTLTVRLSGVLSEHVAASVGEHGEYENVSEYIRDLIRRDRAQKERQALKRLKAELAQAWAAPESSYVPLTAEDVIARNQAPDDGAQSHKAQRSKAQGNKSRKS